MTDAGLERKRAGRHRRHRRVASLKTAAAPMRAADTPDNNPDNDHEVTHARHH
jgi:hypothetical protein